jgi:endonuclease YncB( thermonuclease family)
MKLCVAILMATLSVSTGAAADYLGRATAVVDGDTFTMESESRRIRVRICGIDAPERGQPGYGQAAGALASLVEGKQVHCLQIGEGTVCDGRSKPASRDRIVGQCFIDKLDIAEEMAKSGTVCDWPKFSGGHYKVSDKTCSRK